jgi:hypothetical protein
MSRGLPPSWRGGSHSRSPASKPRHNRRGCRTAYLTLVADQSPDGRVPGPTGRASCVVLMKRVCHGCNVVNTITSKKAAPARRWHEDVLLMAGSARADCGLNLMKRAREIESGSRPRGSCDRQAVFTTGVTVPRSLGTGIVRLTSWRNGWHQSLIRHNLSWSPRCSLRPAGVPHDIYPAFDLV